MHDSSSTRSGLLHTCGFVDGCLELHGPLRYGPELLGALILAHTDCHLSWRGRPRPGLPA